jgi:hypothetical protein
MTPAREDDQRRDQYDDDLPEERPVSLAPLFRTLWLYRQVIAAGVVGLVVLCLLGVVALNVILRSESVASTSFRLTFEGADRGTYPNGTPFSPSELVAPPVLSEVFERNGLEQYGRYEAFKDSVFVLQANEALNLLTLEYQGKLSEPRLTAADRARLEEEFRRRRESLRDPQYSINLRRRERLRSMPRPLMEKILTDILDTWARQAAERKGAIRYNIPTFSRNILPTAFIASEDYIMAIDLVRTKVDRVLQSVSEIATLPGSELVRVGKEQVSLGEVRASLEDVVRFRLQPLVGYIRAMGLSKDPRALNLYIENRLFQIRLDQQQATSRVQRLQESLREYVLQRGGLTVDRAQAGGSAGGGTQSPGVPAMIPQFGETFIDRLIELSTQNNDVQYRQELTDRIIRESLVVASLDRERAYYEDLSRTARSQATAAGEAGREAVQTVNARLQQAIDEILVSIDHVGAIYEEVSKRNLNPSTMLYAKTRPFSLTTRPAITLRTTFLLLGLTLLLALFVVPAACLIHHYFLREVTGWFRRGKSAQSSPTAA